MRNAHATSAMIVWPSTDGTINGGSADAVAAGTIAGTKSAMYVSTSALNWERITLE